MRTRLLLGVLAIVSLAAAFSTRVSRKMPDFEVYYTAAARAAAGAPLYREEDGHFQFKYLPAFAVLASPGARVPLAAAKGAWFTASALLMLALLWASLRGLPELHDPPALLLVLTFVAMAKFFAHELVLGQVNLLFGALAAVALVCLKDGREWPGGLLLAAAFMVKPYAVLFAPWLASRRRRGAFFAMAAGVACVLLLPAVRYGWHGNAELLRAWWHTVRATTAPNVLNQDNVSLAGMAEKWLGPDSSAPLIATLIGGLLVALTMVVVAGRGALTATDALEGGLVLMLIPLLSPQGWDYVLLITAPAVMLLIDNRRALPRGARWAALIAVAVVALSIYDVMGRAGYAAFMRLSVITMCVIVEFGALVALRFRRAA